MAWTAPAALSDPPTAAEFNAQLRDNAKEVWREIAYVELADSVATTTGTESAPVDVISSGILDYVAKPIEITFHCPGWNPSGGGGSISLWDGSTDLGKLIVVGTANMFRPVTCHRRLTPTAGPHEYKARIWTTGGASATAAASGGGVNNTVPTWIRIIQKGG